MPVSSSLHFEVSLNVSQTMCVHFVYLLSMLFFSVCGKLEESYSVLNTVFSTMKTYGQRISFASGRVEMLQGTLVIGCQLNLSYLSYTSLSKKLSSSDYDHLEITHRP